jgi:hypothetical protein
MTTDVCIAHSSEEGLSEAGLSSRVQETDALDRRS